MNGDEMPSGLDYPEQILYLSFEKLYWILKRGGISALMQRRQKRS